MKTCGYCFEKFSIYASVCPHCTREVKKYNISKENDGSGGLLFFILFVGGIFWCLKAIGCPGPW